MWYSIRLFFLLIWAEFFIIFVYFLFSDNHFLFFYNNKQQKHKKISFNFLKFEINKLYHTVTKFYKRFDKTFDQIIWSNLWSYTRLTLQRPLLEINIFLFFLLVSGLDITTRYGAGCLVRKKLDKFAITFLDKLAR